MERSGPAFEQARVRPEVIGLVVLAFCGVTDWFSLLAFVDQRLVWRNGLAFEPWRQLASLGVVGGVAVYAIKKSGLLALAGRPRGAASPAAAHSWLYFLAHFRLSIAALLATLVAGWVVRAQLVMWLVAPLLAAWGDAALGVERAQLLHFGSAAEVGRVLLLSVLGVIWVPVVPFVASDAWRLMLPLMNARAARFRVAFAVVVGLVALAVVLVVRQYLGPSAFGFALPDRPEL